MAMGDAMSTEYAAASCTAAPYAGEQRIYRIFQLPKHIEHATKQGRAICVIVARYACRMRHMRMVPLGRMRAYVALSLR
jgi:hypothetical protein